MFSKNLSISILQLCISRYLSYEEATERCDLSPRYFDSIARGQTDVSLSTFEKLCKGFKLTPNELLRIPPLSDCRVPMAFICRRGICPICICCKLTLDREHRYFCNRCGQALDWKDFSNAIIIFPSWL